MLSHQGACLLTECTEMWNIFMGFGVKVDVLQPTSWLMSWVAFWLMPSNFFVIVRVKISALYAA
jgi:hypothetical protein